MVANLALFRGAEAYSGTVFEKSMATASGFACGAAGLGAILTNAATRTANAEEALAVMVRTVRAAP